MVGPALSPPRELQSEFHTRVARTLAEIRQLELRYSPGKQFADELGSPLVGDDSVERTARRMLLADAKWFVRCWLHSQPLSPLMSSGEARTQLENLIPLVVTNVTAGAWLPEEDDPAPDWEGFVRFGEEGNVEIIREFTPEHRAAFDRISDSSGRQAYRERWARKQLWESRRHGPCGLLEEAIGDTCWRHLFRSRVAQEQLEGELREALYPEMEAMLLVHFGGLSSFPTAMVQWMKSTAPPAEIVEGILSSPSPRRQEAITIFLSELAITQNSVARELEVHATSVHNCLYPKQPGPQPSGRPSKVRDRLVALLTERLVRYRESHP